MKYYPKSKILVKQTPGNEFVYKFNNKNYIGFYLELSDGTYFTGNDVRNPGKELIVAKESGISKGLTINGKIYNVLNKKTFKKLQKVKPIVATRPKPTKEDYEKGKYFRYFTRKANNPNGYFEIDKETYNALNSKSSEFDYNMFKPGQIEWSLEKDAYTINTKALRVYEETYPNISNFFRNPGEFSRKLG